MEEYLQQYDEDLSVWPSNQFIKALKAKQNGFFMYFRNYRECEVRFLVFALRSVPPQLLNSSSLPPNTLRIGQDKYLNRVKLFSY